MTRADTDALATAIVKGQRRALAKALTLVESTHPDKRRQGLELTQTLMRQGHTGGSLRLAVSGPPGVGKSTFIEAFGLAARRHGLKVAVLAVDPSSPLTGGSILGDKTRMGNLALDDQVFIRPSPAHGALGGVRLGTRESIYLCEAAGFNLVIVETVGVGQSEIEAHLMVDLFMTLLQAHAGDELQGIKKGIIEISDILVVTKADGPLEAQAELTATEYRKALHYAPPRPAGPTEVFTASSFTGARIDKILDHILQRQAQLLSKNQWQDKRHRQLEDWLKSQVFQTFHELLAQYPPFQKAYAEALEKVLKAQQLPPEAAQGFWQKCGIPLVPANPSQ